MDKFSLCAVFLYLARLLQLSSQADKDKYVATVVEFSPNLNPWRNLELYGNIVKNAKLEYESDIIIFPESTLTVERGWASLVPDPKDKIIPYKNDAYKNFRAIHNMSQTAAEYSAYVVVNLLERENCTKSQEGCPERGYFLYNTNVAFDRKGTVVARYRKVNVYNNDTDRPEGQELSTFTTDFGVSFGLMTCFDILFKNPSLDLVTERNIKHIIFPSHWYGELPFLTAAQVQGGWSYANNVTLFASGANNPSIGSTGTGIFFGRKSYINVMLEKSGTFYLHRASPKSLTPPGYVQTEEEEVEAAEPRGLYLLQDPSIPEAKKMDLDFDKTKFNHTVSHGGLSCKFYIEYKSLMETSPDGYTYKAVAFQGERRFGIDMTHDVAYCGVVLCVRDNCAEKPSNDKFPLLFQTIKIEAEFKTENTFQMPSTLTWRNKTNGLQLLHLLDYDSFSFERGDASKGNSRVTMELKPGEVKNLMTFAIFGRKFD